MIKTFFICCSVVLLSVSAFGAADQQKLDARLDAVRTAIDEMMTGPDKAIPNKVTPAATCLAVVPGVGKSLCPRCRVRPSGDDLPRPTWLERACIQSA